MSSSATAFDKLEQFVRDRDALPTLTHGADDGQDAGGGGLHRAPRRVWVSWCDACGRPDYAFRAPPARKPNDEVAGCPRCETGSEYQRVAGPYDFGSGDL